MTYDRFRGFCPDENVWVVSNEIYADVLAEQLPMLPTDNLLLEPNKRNTAPCIAYAAYKIRAKDENAVMVVLPSDHVIFKEADFIEVIKKSIIGAGNDKLITIGIQPNRPETGYGYIQFNSDVEEEVKPVKTFTEKPQLDLAVEFLRSGDFVWNAGIFVWKANTIIAALERYQSELAEIFSEGEGIYFTPREKDFIASAYAQSKSVSIDYAIMEKADNVHVVLGEFGWSDLGSWNALHEIKEKDNHGNVVEANALLYDCNDNYIINKNKDKLTVLHNMDGYLIADFEDVLLICKKEDSGIFRDFVSDVRLEKGEKFI